MFGAGWAGSGLGSLNNGRRQFRGRKGQIVMRLGGYLAGGASSGFWSGQLFRKGRQSGSGLAFAGAGFAWFLGIAVGLPAGVNLAAPKTGSWLRSGRRTAKLAVCKIGVLKRRHLSDYYGRGHLPEQRSWMFWPLRCAP